jgi:DNA-binding NtrC family response regulator
MQGESRESRPAQLSANQFRAKLLVVDEKLDDLLYYSRVLQLAGYDVRSIASYSEAAASLEDDSYDLIITSKGSPNFTGRSMLARVIEKHRGTPVLVLDPCADSALYLEVMPSDPPDNAERALQPSEIATLVAHYLPDATGKA